MEMLRAQIKDLDVKLTEDVAESVQLQNDVDGLEDFDEQKIKDQVATAEETNVKAREYHQSLVNQKAYETEKTKHDTKNDEIAVVDTKRTKYIQAQELPFNNITINDQGELRIDEKPFREPYFSTGEALKFGALLGAKIAERRGGDKLDYVWISGCQDLDDENRGKLFAALAKANLQVACEFVDTKKQKKGHSILLRECQIVDSYDKKESGQELE